MGAHPTEFLPRLSARSKTSDFLVFVSTCLLAIIFSPSFAYGESKASSSKSGDANKFLNAAPGTEHDAASQAFVQAEELRSRWEADAFRQSIGKYEEAAVAWEVIAPGRAATALLKAGDVNFLLSEYRPALALYERALKTANAARDQALKLQALNSIAYVYIYLGENRKALAYETRVLRDCKRLPPSINEATKVSIEAQALNNIGEIYYGLGDLKASLKFFADAIRLWTRVNDRRGLALAHINLGYSYADSGDLLEAADHYGQSLAISEEIGDRRGQAQANTVLGGVYALLGAKQRALDFRAEALTNFRRMGNNQGAAIAINGIAEAYEELNNYPMALEHYQQALNLYQMIGHRGFVALNKYCIGRVYFAMEQPVQARAAYMEGLAVSRDVGDQQIEAHILKGLGNIDSREGDNQAALARFGKVLNLYLKIGDRRNQAYTLNSIGHVYHASGQPARALTHFRQALLLIRTTKDRRGEVLTLYNVARVEHEQGNLEKALSSVQESVNLIEKSRAMIESVDLRMSYFAGEHKHYELFIDLLMQLHEREPTKNHAANAFLASERARVRSLLDTRMSAGFSREADSSRLPTRERELAQLLDIKGAYQARLLSGKHTAAEANEAAEKLRLLSSEYEAIQSQLREQNPLYAVFAQGHQTTLDEIQAQLDSNTLLLEFSLGEQRSYLWIVSQKSINGYELPARRILEDSAGKVYNFAIARQLAYEGRSPQNGGSIQGSDDQYLTEALALSSTLLERVAPQLGSKRLLLVSDGALQYIPFDALPVPVPRSKTDESTANSPDFLIDHHEIVELPSASILVAMRQKKSRFASAKTVAVVADPVFDRNDPRVSPDSDQPTRVSKALDDAHFEKVSRSLNGDASPRAIPRLRASLREANAIMALTQPGEGTMAVGFEASRGRIMSDDFRQHRILHFATHGIVDSEDPEISGLILSMVDKTGNPQNGYFRLADIYNLNTQAELVVLSACRTRLGRSVRGEGLIGLSRGFMFAGSKSIVGSLWKVDDEATAELMSSFYAAMLRDGLPPGAALRRAKQTIRAKSQWRAPYFWAAFVLQGEYGETLARNRNPKSSRATLLITTIILTIAFLLLWLGRKRLQ